MNEHEIKPQGSIKPFSGDWFFRSKWKDAQGRWWASVYRRPKMESEYKKTLKEMQINFAVYPQKVSAKTIKQEKQRQKFYAQRIKAGYKEVWG